MFNCVRINPFEKQYPDLFEKIYNQSGVTPLDICIEDRKRMDDLNLPNYFLDCQLYQRSDT